MTGRMFAQNALVVAVQVGALFIMMGAGYIMYKTRMLRRSGVSQMTDLLLWAVTPCLLLNSFSRKLDSSVAKSLLIFSGCAALIIAGTLTLMLLLFRRRCEDDRVVMRFASAFSNCGFMGIPIAQALYGEDGVMYASIFVAVFNLLQWSYGYLVMSGSGVSLRKSILNPGVIGLAISLPVFLFSIELPQIISIPVESVAGINTPVAMIVIGAQLAETDIKSALKDKAVYGVSLIRLVAVPAAVSAALVLLPVPLDPLAKTVLLVESAAPAAATTAIMSRMVGRNSELAGRLVAVTTLFSAITMPLFVTFGELLFK